MKQIKRLLFFVFCIILYAHSSFAQNVNIPDANFKNYLLSNNDINTNADTVLSVVEANAFSGEINVYNSGIADLTGIEAFVNLTSLDCSGNLSLTNIDVTQNLALTHLVITLTGIGTIDLTNNTSLTYFATSSLRLLDVSQNVLLDTLICPHYNFFSSSPALKSLNVQNNTALKYLDISTDSITTLDLSNNTQLKYLNCGGNLLTTLDLANNIQLEYLNCGGNSLTALDVTQLTSLMFLNCAQNQLSSIDVSSLNMLKTLVCGTNTLTNININQSSLLDSLDVSSNQLTALDVSVNNLLQGLNCSNNSLVALDVSSCQSLKSLNCSGNAGLNTICVKSLGKAYNDYKKDSSASWSMCNTLSDGIIQSFLVKSVSANGVCDGSASVSVSGTPPYSYLWSSGETSASITNKCGAKYSVIVSDALGEKDTISMLIAEPLANCTGFCPDTLTTFIANQAVPFFQSVTIDMTLPDSTFNPVVGMIYFDSLHLDYVDNLPKGLNWSSDCGVNTGCMYTNSGRKSIVFFGTPEKIETDTIEVICSGYFSGNGGVFGPGGPTTSTSRYKYIIKVDSASIIHSLISSYHSTNVSSFGLCDGSASVVATSGIPPYTYLWSSGDSTSAITGKCSDKYSVVVTDFTGVKDSVQIYISEPTDTIVNTTNSIVGLPIVDSLITNYDTCIVDNNYPVDSAFIVSFTITDSSHVLVDYAIYQQGNKITFTAEYDFISQGNNVLLLALNCTGTFTRMLKSTVISQEVDLQYAQIGVNQLVPHVSNNPASAIELTEKINSVRIYPNPFSSSATLLLEEEVNNAEVTIVNILGETVKRSTIKGTQLELKRDGLSPGIYFIQVIVNHVIIVCEKVIVE